MNTISGMIKDLQHSELLADELYETLPVQFKNECEANPQISTTAGELIIALHRLEELEHHNEWIPVERELPENDERMLVVLINGTHYKYKVIARHCGDNEWVDDNWDDVDGVVAWMPIPTYEVTND